GIDREKVRLQLWEQQIETRPVWKPMHLQPIFADCECINNGVAEELFFQGLCLPSGSNLSEANLERVITAIKDVYSK
ncbi:MAG: DegT/DnrJ/EryC1/StrS family aminotransferase, partial [Waterburya sp.]